MTTALIRALWLLVFLLPAAGAQGMRDAADLAAEAGNPSQAERQQVQPYNNAPVWRAVRSGEEHFTTVRSNVPETGVLINDGGEAWRTVRNGPITVYGGILILAVPLLILIFYAAKGPLRVHGRLTGRMIQRFNRWERVVHWATAISFVILAVTGLILLLGKHVLLPLIGYSLFSWLATLSINLHNFVGPLFIVCVLLMFFTFLKDNIWRRHDWQWLRKGGGMLTGEDVPSGRFNAGEKSWFWFGVFFLSIFVAASGLVLDFPNFYQGRTTMQIANLVHVTAAILYIAGAFGHIYMGTIGSEGAYEAMRHGYVDETWAREHHQYWYEEVKAGKVGAKVKPAGQVQPT
ncbi:MAG: formate dehydrogenase subunit gamma [Pseudomonadota bacterium]|nr:formate dehydrogenase subunit gamma [Pseudomonadota bacterium]